MVRTRLAAIRSVAIPRRIKVEMVPVGRIGIRSQDRSENSAGVILQAPQALALALSVPTVQHADFIAIAQTKPSNVYGPTLGMF